MDYIKKLREMVIEGEDEEIVDCIKEALDNGVNPGEIVDKSLVAAMDIVGPMMASGELFVPEVLMSAETMKIGLEYLKPMLQEGDVKVLGKVVIGTVEGDLHDIGKNLVAMMLESSGFEVINLGIDQSPQAFLDAAIEHDADIVGLSALLTTTMPAMRDTVKLLKNNEVKAKVVVGGAPVSEEFSKEIEADGYSEDGPSAVTLCKNLLNVYFTN